MEPQKPWYKSKKLWVAAGAGLLATLGSVLTLALEAVDKGSTVYVVLSAVAALAGVAMAYLKAQGGIDAARELTKSTQNPPQSPPSE